jgi:Zn-finger nucleic acid-binding protein
MANKWDERRKAQEDEYFLKKEKEQLAKLRAKNEAEAKTDAKPDSYMKCPKCGAQLKERSFQKIVIDQCGACHGIWLDAGELEQVAEKESGGWLGKFWQKNG